MNSLRPGDAYASLNWVIIGLTNGSSLVWHQALTWWKLQRNCNRNLNVFNRERLLEISAEKWRPFCLGLNVLNIQFRIICFNKCVDFTSVFTGAVCSILCKASSYIGYSSDIIVNFLLFVIYWHRWEISKDAIERLPCVVRGASSMCIGAGHLTFD